MKSVTHIFLSILLLTGPFLLAQTTDWDTTTIGKVYYTGGNVGIGLNDPQSLLHIKKVDLSASQEIEFLTGTITSSYKLQIGLNDDGVNFTNNSSSRGFNFKNAAHDDLLTINENGRVKIAENSASAGVKLEVNGFTRLNGFSIASPALGIKSNGTANSFLIAEASSSSNRVLDMVENNNGSFIRLYKDGTSNTQISAVGDSYFNGGNLGIGTTNPGDKLDINGNIRTSQGSGGILTLFDDDGSRKNRFIAGADADGAFISSSYGNTGGTYALRFMRGNKQYESMRIDHIGNVGIGTTTPSAKLDVKGQDVDFISSTSQNTMRIGRGYNEYFKLNVNDYTGYLDYHQDSDGDRDHVFYIRNMALGNSANNDIRFQTNSTDRMTIKTNGNIGIGTTSPEGNLQIGSGTTQGLVLIGGGKGKPAIASTRSDGGLILGKNIYTKYDNASENSIGRVAISSTNGISGIKMSHNGVIDFFGVNGSVTADHVANDDSNIKMKINEDGNIGIGTIDPGTYKLAVEGQIGARSVKVTQAAWADYVFTPSYPLMPLNQVEAYIAKNQHLPNVPSAKEIEEKGFVLEEMDAKLMEKIEELTLYAIEQKDQIEQLQQIILSQNIRITQLEKCR